MRLTKDQSRKRWRELQDLLCDWDPIGAIPLGVPRDEYDCLSGPILRLLESAAGEERLAHFLTAQLTDHFGLGNVPIQRDFARKLVAWYANNWPGSDVRDGLAE